MEVIILPNSMWISPTNSVCVWDGPKSFEIQSLVSVINSSFNTHMNI